MKSIKTIRSIVAMMVIFFAVAATSCKKESDITPDTGTTTPVSPPVTIPTAPAVSIKPTSIITTEGNTAIRKQIYKYDDQGKLMTYISKTNTGITDSVEMQTNAVTYKTGNVTSRSRITLTFNPDKTVKSIFTATEQADFVNNQTKLNSLELIRPNSTPERGMLFTYNGNNISEIQTEGQKLDINYFDNLPYQKGINEIPFGFAVVKYFKAMEMENVTSTLAFDKLIRQIIIDNHRGNLELHEYSYVMDAQSRVTKITDTVTVTTSTSSLQKTLISVVNY